MKWVVVIGAFLFALVALSMIAPVVATDPFSILAALMVGVFIGMLIQSQECR